MKPIITTKQNSHLFKLLLGGSPLLVGSVAVTIWMMLQGSPLVRFLDLFLRSRFTAAQNLVIVFSLGHFQFDVGVSKSLFGLSAVLHLVEFLCVSHCLVVLVKFLVAHYPSSIRLDVALV